MRFTIEWCRAALIRALRTAAQVALTMLTIGMTASEVDWKLLLSSSLVAAVYSILTSVVTDLPEAKIPQPEGTIWLDEETDDISSVNIDIDDPDLKDKEVVTLYVGKHSTEN